MGITRGITEFWGGLTGSRAGQVALRRARGRWWTVGIQGLGKRKASETQQVGARECEK